MEICYEEMTRENFITFRLVMGLDSVYKRHPKKEFSEILAIFLGVFDRQHKWCGKFGCRKLTKARTAS